MLQIDGTFIFVFISFLLFVLLMNLICYKPVMKIITERENFLKKNKIAVFEANFKKDEIEKTAEKELQNARFESSKMLLSAVEENKAKKEKALYIQKAQIAASMQEFENELNKSSIEVKNRLNTEIETYVRGVVSKVLNINPKDVDLDGSKIGGVLK